MWQNISEKRHKKKHLQDRNDKKTTEKELQNHLYCKKKQTDLLLKLIKCSDIFPLFIIFAQLFLQYL